MRILMCFISSLLLFTTANAAEFSLTTNAFKDQGRIPTLYSCDGKNISPALTWSNAPTKTESFALILASPDWSAGSVYLWVLYNIPKNIFSLPEGANRELPEGIQVGTNYYNEAGYNGPCPPDSLNHHYVFTIYALDSMLDIPYNTDTDTIADRIKEHTLKQAHVTGTFSH